MTAQQEAGAFQPRPGDRLTVRRYIQPTLKTGDPNRRLTLQFSAVLVTTEYLSSTDTRYHFDVDSAVVDFTEEPVPDTGTLRMIADGYVFLKPDYLVTEVAPFTAGREDAFRVTLGPDLAVVLDASQCIVLEVSEPYGLVLRRVTVADVSALRKALDAALAAQHAVTDQAEWQRWLGLQEARRARGQLVRSEAVPWLMERGFPHGEALGLTARLREGTEEANSAGMTYATPYWVVPVSTDAI